MSLCVDTQLIIAVVTFERDAAGQSFIRFSRVGRETARKQPSTVLFIQAYPLR